MGKPDFEKMASDFWRAMRDKKAVSLVAVLESAFDAGLERAADIADGVGGSFTTKDGRYNDNDDYAAACACGKVADAIRAEKSQ